MNRTTRLAVTRRDFLKTSAAASAAALLGGFATQAAHAAGSDALKVGVIGCGGRGTGAAKNCVESSPNVTITAVADMFPERQAGIVKAYKVPADRCFTGFDAYQKLLATDVNMVILATPPGFRPIHFKAAIEAGKHVFIEKPVCVDPVGYRSICATADLAKEKKLCVVAGTQRRHTNSYRECVKRIKDGAIGDVVSAQCYWMGSPVHHRGEQKPGMSDIEFQIRNWYNWTWLCGDHIMEQHVHNIDVINWVMGGPPAKAVGIGGRSCREEKGNIFDHFAIEFEYASGVRVASYCSHIDKGVNRVTENVVGSKGSATPGGTIKGAAAWKFEGENPNGQMLEHRDLIAAIRGAAPYVNEGRQVAESSMTAVLGRMVAYTGREVSWQWATEKSQLNLMPPKLEFGPFAPPAIAIPGQTELI